MPNKVQLGDDKHCRACLQKLKSSECNREELKMYHIFPDLVQKFLACTTIKVDLNDEFPKYLCDCCYDKLNKFHAFQIMCINSIQRYREMLGINEIKPRNEEVRKEPLKDYYSDESDSKQSLHVTAFLEEEIHNTMLPETTSKENPLNMGSRRKRKRRSKRNIFESPKKFSEDAEKCNDSDSLSITSHQNAEISSTNSDDTVASDSCMSPSPQAETIFGEQKPISNRCAESNSNSLKSSNVYQCYNCSRRFFVKHRFVAHQRIHDGLVPYPCPNEGCTRGFQRWHCLSEHLKQHEGTNRWFLCEEKECGRKYKHKSTLDIHLRRFHKKGPELQTFVCEICGKVFKSSAILNSHRFTHKEKSELPFACNQPQCKYRFSNRAKLKVHLMRHAGIKKFECPHCGMRKTTRNELKTHINYHTLERTFPCRFCAQVCNSAGNLKVHIRTVHERAKDYACRFCERTFAKPDTRKYHEMIHTGEKPHQCADCGKRFVQPAALRTHNKMHQKQKQHESTSPNVQASKDKVIEPIGENGDTGVQFGLIMSKITSFNECK